MNVTNRLLSDMNAKGVTKLTVDVLQNLIDERTTKLGRFRTFKVIGLMVLYSFLIIAYEQTHDFTSLAIIPVVFFALIAEVAQATLREPFEEFLEACIQEEKRPHILLLMPFDKYYITLVQLKKCIELDKTPLNTPITADSLKIGSVSNQLTYLHDETLLGTQCTLNNLEG